MKRLRVWWWRAVLQISYWMHSDALWRVAVMREHKARQALLPPGYWDDDA